MSEFAFGEADRTQFMALGISEHNIRRQIELFQKPSFHVCLDRICSLGDGVDSIVAQETERYLRIHQRAATEGRFTKFVPASGAATRMFQCLFQVKQQVPSLEPDLISERAEGRDNAAKAFLQFFGNISHYAFYEDLRQVMLKENFDLDRLLKENNYFPILEYLLSDCGLNYSSLPKGLLKFHSYSFGSRTALEEHLIEAAQYVKDQKGICRLHITISAEQRDKFETLLGRLKTDYEEQCFAHFEVSFSTQKPSTQTIAVDLDNHPARDQAGRLVFRPGGHGALLENLNDLGGDLVYIKNIDNVAHSRHQDHTFFWKRVIGGYLVEIQETVHAHIRRLQKEKSLEAVQKAYDYSTKRLPLDYPEAFENWTLLRKRDYLLHKLDRPIRVCGVVRNVGEPGGAPFWVRGSDGVLSIQIVEKSQVDFSSHGQKSVWDRSTHFNPVDLVCALRDSEGKPYNLTQYVDLDTFFISLKFHNGLRLKVLEHPGLWNGSMADWITLCVEVPRITFNPVKSAEDLLNSEHQPE